MVSLTHMYGFSTNMYGEVEMNSDKPEDSKKNMGMKFSYLIALGIIMVSLFFVFPMLINAGTQNPQEKNVASQVTLAPASIGTQNLSLEGSSQTITLEVQIPCQGHTQYIVEEITKISGVLNVKSIAWNKFQVNFDTTKTTKDQILKANIFGTYPAKLTN